MKGIGPGAKDGDLWVLIWEEVRRIQQAGVLVEIEHVKARVSKKEKQETTLLQCAA